ncbi:hypothetical protein [Actinophytocola sediminis]
MAAVTAEQVRAARDAGYAAGRSLAPPSPNPLAPEHVPAWRQPRTAAGRAAAERDRAAARILARVWRVGYQTGQAAYARERGLPGA